MASKAPPPLIRSSKAFSVEIPEGSNSAKSRRSDVVGSDDLDIHKSSSNFQSQDLDRGSSKGFHADQPLGLGSAFDEDHAELDSAHVNDHQEALKDRFAADQAGSAHAGNMGHEDQTPPENLAKLPGQAQVAPAKGVDLDIDALKDRFAGGESGREQQAHGVPVVDDAHKDNLQGLGNDAIHDNLQGVGNDAINDNKAGIAKEPEAVHKPLGVGKEAIQDNLQGVANEALHDHMQGLGNDAIQDNVQGVGNEAEHHNKAGVAKDAITDNKAGVAKDAITDNKAGVAKDAITDNKAGVPKEGITDNKAGVGKEHLEDHIEQLPDTARPLKDGPKPGVRPTDASGGHRADAQGLSSTNRKTLTDRHPSSKKELDAAHAQAVLLAQQEKAKKMEEFHGRVDAIRKTVSGINHKLDEIDEDDAPIKR
jgi:hypothetical protein